MRISDRYIGRQVLAGTLAAVVVLSLVLVMGNLFKEIRPLLVDKHAPPHLVLHLMRNALLVSLMYSIPWGFLSTVLLVIGRMSATQEITSFRVAGVGLTRLMLPVFVIAAGLSACCLWLNTSVVPKGKMPIKELLYQQAKRDPGSLLRPGLVHNYREAGVRLFVEGGTGEERTGLHLYRVPRQINPFSNFQLPGSTPPAATLPPPRSQKEAVAQAAALLEEQANRSIISPSLRLNAGRFTYVLDAPREELRLKLYNAIFQTEKQKKPQSPEDLTASGPPPADQESPAGGIELFIASEAEPYLIPFGELFQKKFKAATMTNLEIQDWLLDHSSPSDEMRRNDLQTEVSRRYAISLACLAFSFIGVPLAIQSRRRESSVGLVASLLIAGGYYLFTMLAAENSGGLSATLLLWAPNAACLALGLWLLRRAKYR